MKSTKPSKRDDGGSRRGGKRGGSKTSSWKSIQREKDLRQQRNFPVPLGKNGS